MKYSLLKDAKLIELIKKEEDVVAFNEVYHRYWFVIFKTAKQKLGSVELAEEITQDIFTDLWERRKITQIEHLKSYLYGALKFQVYNYVRGKLVHQSYEKSKQYFQIEFVNHTADIIAYRDLSDAVENAVAKLPEKTKMIFKLNHFEHHSPQEISILLQIPQRTIEHHLTQSSRLLRIRLREFI